MKTFIAESSIILIFITVASTNFQGNSCRTPDNFDGTCVRLNLCPPLYKLALSPQLTSQQQNFLRESRCGFQLNYPLVCCRNRFNDLPTPGNCGVQAKDRIVGGEETSIQDYPWMALLQYRNRQGVNIGFLCGGVLIHKNYVLTAAHCIRGINIIQNGYSIATVRLGEHDLRSEEDCQEVPLNVCGYCQEPGMDLQRLNNSDLLEMMKLHNMSHTRATKFCRTCRDRIRAKFQRRQLNIRLTAQKAPTSSDDRSASYSNISNPVLSTSGSTSSGSGSGSKSPMQYPAVPSTQSSTSGQSADQSNTSRRRTRSQGPTIEIDIDDNNECNRSSSQSMQAAPMTKNPAQRTQQLDSSTSSEMQNMTPTERSQSLRTYNRGRGG